MTTPEAWNRLLPHTQNYRGAGGAPDKTREDLLQASQGMSPELQAYINFTVLSDEKARHKLFAAMFAEAMEIHEVQEFSAKSKRRRCVEQMVMLAIMELAHPEVRLTARTRARIFDVSRRTWFRRWARVYDRIQTIPTYWEYELRNVGRKLK